MTTGGGGETAATGLVRRSVTTGAAYAIAFLGGSTLMMGEILAGRLMAPEFGSSVVQWGALIGVVLTAMSAGYVTGGRIAEGGRGLPFLAKAFGIAAAFTLCVPIIAAVVLPRLSWMGLIPGAVAASIVTTALPAFLMATVSPILIKTLSTDRVGETAGNVYAVSTVGSILGTFFAAFVGVPLIGVEESHWLTAGLQLAALALLLLDRVFVAVIVIAGGIASQMVRAPSDAPEGTVVRMESIYQPITVYDEGPNRIMGFDRHSQQSRWNRAMLVDPLTYYPHLLTAAHLTLPKQGGRVLLLGLGGGVMIRQIDRLFPGTVVDGVDIDAAVVEIARDHFGLSELPAHRLYVDDARRFLSRTEERYDLILLDAYGSSAHVPEHCITDSFFALARSRLKPGGIVAANVIGDSREGPFLRSVAATIRTAFDTVLHFPDTRRADGYGNHTFLMFDQQVEASAIADRLRLYRGDSGLEEAFQRYAEAIGPASLDPAPVLTDNRSNATLLLLPILRRSFKPRTEL